MGEQGISCSGENFGSLRGEFIRQISISVLLPIERSSWAASFVAAASGPLPLGGRTEYVEIDEEVAHMQGRRDHSSSVSRWNRRQMRRRRSAPIRSAQ